jgi:hypothetical protein
MTQRFAAGRLAQRAAAAAKGVRRRLRLARRLADARVDLAAQSRDPTPVIVFFAPEAGVEPHFAAHCLLARTLKELGERVLVVRCFDLFPRCIVMDAVNAPAKFSREARRSLCQGCAESALRMADEYELDVLDLRDLIDDTTISGIRRSLADHPGELDTFEYAGIRIGELAAADTAVNFKAAEAMAPGSEAADVRRRYAEGAMLSLHVMEKILRLFRVRCLVHFNEYAILMGAAMAARRANVPVANITLAYLRGTDQRRIQIIPEALKVLGTQKARELWPEWRQLALPTATVHELGRDSIFRMSGGSVFVYSPLRSGRSENLLSRLNLSADRKLLVAFTSSVDELRAQDRTMRAVGANLFPPVQPFRDQAEWLDRLIDFVEKRDDLQLVVRVHPREGPNRRDPRTSEHLDMLRARFSGSYRRARMVWPQDPISSYDLAELADVGLTAWSSMGVEMAMCGLPVVLAFQRYVPYPIGDFLDWHPTPEGYFELVIRALQQTPSLARIGLAYRWRNLFLFGSAIDFSDVVPTSDYRGLPPFRMPMSAPLLADIVVRGIAARTTNLQWLRGRQAASLEREESQALESELRRLIWFLCRGEERVDDYRLFLADKNGNDVPAGYDAAIFCEAGMIEFRAAGDVSCRRSRMVERLALLASRNTSPGRVTGGVVAPIGELQ